MRARRISFSFLLAFLPAPGATLGGDTESWGFDRDAPGKRPAGFESALTGQGEPGRWIVEAVADAPSPPHAVKQTSTDATSYRFPILVASDAAAEDGTLSVRFKALSGQVDRAAGLVWRYRDENNYYIVRANALEDNVVLYKVENGKRSSLAPRGTAARTYGVDHEVPDQAWNELRVSFRGNLFTVHFNGEELFEVEDGTFGGSGKIGLWTKADSVTLFDDLRLEP